jgi:hypothetical protein
VSIGIRRTWTVLGLIVGTFFIVRAVVELLTIEYSDPSSYADDWAARASRESCSFIAASGSSRRS